MDLSSIIIGLVFLAMFVAPVIYLNRVSKQKRNVLGSIFDELCKKNGINADETDQWDTKMIGVDRVQQKLVFMNKIDEVESKIIDLKTVKKCRVVNVSKSVEGAALIERLELEFTFADKNKALELISFYQRNQSLQLENELVLIQKWQILISGLL